MVGDDGVMWESLIEIFGELLTEYLGISVGEGEVYRLLLLSAAISLFTIAIVRWRYFANLTKPTRSLLDKRERVTGIYVQSLLKEGDLFHTILSVMPHRTRSEVRYRVSGTMFSPEGLGICEFYSTTEVFDEGKGVSVEYIWEGVSIRDFGNRKKYSRIKGLTSIDFDTSSRKSIYNGAGFIVDFVEQTWMEDMIVTKVNKSILRSTIGKQDLNDLPALEAFVEEFNSVYGAEILTRLKR